MHNLIPLKTLRAGQEAFVRQVMGAANQVKRMEELGIRDGASVRVLQSGSPCIVQLGNQKLCFRDCDLLSVLVSPAGAEA